MENKPGKIKGFACLCDDKGKIIQVLQNDLDLVSNELAGELFVNLVDKKSKTKATNFLIDIKSSEVAFNYQLNIWFENKTQTLSFLGIHVKNNEIVIIGAKNQEDAIVFTNQLQKINNEQANLIRKLMKEKIDFQSNRKNENEQSYDDLTGLNNELINLQRELAKKNAELERLNETKNRFLGMAAHDLRSPLAIIQGYAAFLTENASSELSEKNLMFLNTIYSTSEFMLNLVEDLLNVSKIESGKLELNKETFDLTEFVKRNIELNKVLAGDKNIDINLTGSPGSIQIFADRHKIEQVFNNLLNNAIKFSYSGTNIQVDISHFNGKAKVSVKDQGKGIPKDQQDKIFQPFGKTSETGTEGEQGTGLGLLIVKRIVEGHGGEIWVKSEPKEGTAFTFTLPMEEESKQEIGNK